VKTGQTLIIIIVFTITVTIISQAEREAVPLLHLMMTTTASIVTPVSEKISSIQRSTTSEGTTPQVTAEVPHPPQV
jgi:hypothetical protein